MCIRDRTQIFRQLGKFFAWLGSLLKRFGAYLKEIYAVLMSGSEEEALPKEKKIIETGDKRGPGISGPAVDFSGDERAQAGEWTGEPPALESYYQKERRLALVEPPENDEPVSYTHLDVYKRQRVHTP